MARFAKVLLVFLVFGSLVLAACGGDSEDTSGSSSNGAGNTSAGATSNDGGSSSSSSSSSSSKFTGDAKDVEAAMKGYFDAYLKEDAAKAYTFLDAGSKAKCDQAKFATNVTGMNAVYRMSGTKEVKYSRATEIKVTGDTANAKAEILFDGKPAVAGPISATLHKESGKWLVEDVCQ